MPIYKELPSASELKKIVTISSVGEFISIKTGNILKQSITTNGYCRICLNSNSYASQRLIYTYFKGDFPRNYMVDHINGIKTDNRIENLRLITGHYENAQNTIKYKNNKSGYHGVWKVSNRYYSAIQVKGKRIYLGGFKTALIAHEAYVNARKIYFNVQPVSRDKLLT
jgi:hypothetical protein